MTYSSIPFSQIIAWSSDNWERQNSTFLQTPAGRTGMSDTQVQFHQDQTHFLVVHETQLSIYEASKLERILQVEQSNIASKTVMNLKIYYNVDLVFLF